MHKMKRFDIIYTINHNNYSPESCRGHRDNGVTIFRINGSFLRPDNFETVCGIVVQVRDRINDDIKFLLDLPGYKIRFLNLPGNMQLHKATPQRFEARWFNHPGFICHLFKDSELRINDGMVTLSIIDIGDDYVTVVPDQDCQLTVGRGLHLSKVSYRGIKHCLTDFDRNLIQFAQDSRFDALGLSFVNDGKDLEYVSSLVEGTGLTIIPKVESKMSVENLTEILSQTDRIIVDRGDLSGEMGIENIWSLQRDIVKVAHVMGKSVILATQFFASMLHKPLPTIAEIDSFCDLLSIGFDGVQLSEETSIGDFAPNVLHFINISLDKMAMNRRINPALVPSLIWLMGPTASGKTTLARLLEERFSDSGLSVITYDGDEARDLFEDKLSFSEDDRLLVVKSIIHHSRKMIEKGFIVIVSALTASERSRQLVRKTFNNVFVVYLDADVDTCRQRDHKGLYSKALTGEIQTLVGVNTPYLTPSSDFYSVKVPTCDTTPQEVLETILGAMLSSDRK